MLAEQALDEPLPGFAVVAQQAHEDGARDVAQVVGGVVVEAGEPHAVGGERVNGLEQLLRALSGGRGSALGPVRPELRRPFLRHVTSMFSRLRVEGGARLHESQQRAIEGDGGIVLKKRGVEPVVDDVIVQPRHHEAVDLG